MSIYNCLRNDRYQNLFHAYYSGAITILPSPFHTWEPVFRPFWTSVSLSRSFNLEMSSRKGFDMAADRGRKREGKSGKKKEKKREKEIGFEERPVPPCLLHPVDLETSWQTEEEVATASFEIRGRDCAMLRNTMTSERPLSDTLPHPRGSSLSRRIHEEEEDEERGGIRQKEMENREKSGKEEKKKSYKPMCGRFFTLSLVYLLFIFSLSLFPPSLLSSSSSSLSLPDLFVSFAGKNVGLSDGWIYFRTRLSTSPTRDLCENRGPWQTFKRGGDYSYLDEELTTGDALLSRLNA